MDAQLEYVMTEIRRDHVPLNRLLADGSVTLNDACDEVAYEYERPGAISLKNRKLPRTDPHVQQEFMRRRRFAVEALEAYRAALVAR